MPAVRCRDLQIAFGDFVVWQKGQLRGPCPCASLLFTGRQVCEVPAPLEIPAERQGFPQRTRNSARSHFSPAGDDREIEAWLFTGLGSEAVCLLLAALKILMFRYAAPESPWLWALPARASRA